MFAFFLCSTVRIFFVLPVLGNKILFGFDTSIFWNVNIQRYCHKESPEFESNVLVLFFIL